MPHLGEPATPFPISAHGIYEEHPSWQNADPLLKTVMMTARATA
jgi:hypothetical protein